ncbi:PorA family protein [Nocardiopsis nanhaiensis]
MSMVSQVGRAPDKEVEPWRPDRVRRLPKGTFLVAAGAFLITLALLLPLYVHDRVVLLPAEASFDLTMVDDEASYLDTSTWTPVESAELSRTTRVDATAHGSDWAAWEMTVNSSVAEEVIDHWSRRVIVNRETARAVNCCGEHVDGDRAVRQAGLVLNWPPGVSEDDHSFYDAEVRAAPSVEFTGEDEVAGLAVREYTQHVESTQVPESARDVPTALFQSGAEGTVSATRWMEAERTFWVEPRTGTVVNMDEHRIESLRPQNGSGEVALIDAELTLDDGHVSGLTQQARARSLLLQGLDVWAPWSLGPLGAVMVLAGFLKAWRARPSGGEGAAPESASAENSAPERAEAVDATPERAGAADAAHEGS